MTIFLEFRSLEHSVKITKLITVFLISPIFRDINYKKMNFACSLVVGGGGGEEVTYSLFMRVGVALST